MRELVGDNKVIVVCGPGGVGKTSVSAALALYAATNLDQKVLVLTVDPARRLATALGLSDVSNDPQRVPLTNSPDAQLYAAMLDSGAAWDQLIEQCAPDHETAQKILAHPLYPNISQRFVQSREYVAADVLYTLSVQNNFDLIIVDTPPSRNVLDFVNAPQRMLDFLGSRFLQLLSAPSQNVVGRLATAPFYRVANLLLGGDFFKQILQFFALVRTLKPAFENRATTVQQLLRLSTTSVITVSTPDNDVFQRAALLSQALSEAGLHANTLIINRVIPDAVGTPTTPAAIAARVDLDVVRRRQTAVINEAATSSSTTYTAPLLVSDQDRLTQLTSLAEGLKRHTL